MSLARANNSRFEGFFFCEQCKWKGEHGNNRGICEPCERQGLKKLLRWKCVCCDKSTLWNGRSNHNRSKAHEKACASTIGPIRHRSSFLSTISIPQENVQFLLKERERFPFSEELNYIDSQNTTITTTVYSYPFSTFNTTTLENTNSTQNLLDNINTNNTNEIDTINNTDNALPENLDNIEEIFCFIPRTDDAETENKVEIANSLTSEPPVPTPSESETTPSIGETLVLIDIQINSLETELKTLKKKKQDLLNQLYNPESTTTTTTTTTSNPTITHNTTPSLTNTSQYMFSPNSVLRTETPPAFQYGSPFNSPLRYSSLLNSPSNSTLQHGAALNSPFESESPFEYEPSPLTSPLQYGSNIHTPFQFGMIPDIISSPPTEFDSRERTEEEVSELEESPFPIVFDKDSTLPPINFDESPFSPRFDEIIDFDKLPFAIEFDNVIQFDKKCTLSFKTRRFLTVLLSLTKIFNTIMLPALFAQQLMFFFAMISSPKIRISHSS
eukprot:TRINITY_DN4086_c0_g1_i3.p1 TRINITY_DN4086_c0_g1~~TRINITY_DN4086_c0_g1_i3.p1  ORF type:complete len:499 (+),score=111.94 TRINITY_DN4086_c0_g1_i3:1703-3199(+)